MYPESTPASVKALRRHLQKSLRKGALGEAESILDRLRHEDPLSVHTRGSELELLLKQGRLSEATRLAGQLVRTFPASARIHYLAGRVAYRERRYEEALAHLEESLRVCSHWMTRHWIGKSLTQLGRFDQAEAVLNGVVAEHPHAGCDLAWLYERMGDGPRAVQVLETFLNRFPNDTYATRQLQRLRAKNLDPDRLVEEIETLLALGEELPLGVFPEYIERLLSSGQGKLARERIAGHADHMSPVDATRLAWICHRLQASDMACRLFLKTMAHNAQSPKYRTALFSDVIRAGCIDSAIATLREHSGTHRVLWGLIRRLEKRRT